MNILHKNLSGFFAGLPEPAPAAAQPVELSIIILHYRTKDLTLPCIESIFRHAPSCSFEVILVDNQSGDDIQRDLAEQFPSVRYIANVKNTGYAGANNLGMCNASGRYLCLLNSDTLLVENSFDPLVNYMISHPEVGGVGPRLVSGDGRFQLSCGKFPTLVSELVRKILHYRLSINDTRIREYVESGHAELMHVDWVSGACLLLRREVLEKTGLLDEHFFMYFEDLDLCRRISDKGSMIHYYPMTTIVHYGGQSAAHNLMKVMTEYRRSQLYFSKKYYGTAGQATIRFLLFVKFSLYFARWLPEFALRRLLRLDATVAYTRALLAKKVITSVFSPLPSAPEEPAIASLSIRN